MSYVIRNCPAYDYDEEFDYHICKQPLVPYECSVDNCQDCTDCVMKQIVESCKERTVGFIEEGLIKDNILQLLQIEEVE